MQYDYRQGLLLQLEVRLPVSMQNMYCADELVA